MCICIRTEKSVSSAWTLGQRGDGQESFGGSLVDAGFFYPNHCRVVLQMMDAESPLEGLATDQLASEIVTSALEDKRVLPRSNMEQKRNLCYGCLSKLSIYVGYVQHLVLAWLSGYLA